MMNIAFFGATACLTILFASPSLVFAETVKSPTAEEGKFDFEFNGKYQHDQALARDGEREFAVESGYGFSDNLKAKIEFDFKEEHTTGFYFEQFKLQTTYVFIKEENGAFADVGFYGDVSIADRTDGTHDYTAGLTARKKLFEKTSHTANVFIKRDFGDTANNGINFIYRWQSKIALFKEFEPGFELLGDTKKKDAFRDQSLRAGPIAHGKYALDDEGRSIGYELGYLLGVTPATSDGMLKWKVKYEMKF